MENQTTNDLLAAGQLSFDKFREVVLSDYRLCCESREASLMGRKEVLTGKAKFGIFGDGKEVPQVAMARFFKKGDFYTGYYRDQTFAFASGAATIEEFFSQLYADPNPVHDPHSAGRQMNSHFATPLVDEHGNFADLVNRKNLIAGMAPTAGQVPKTVGLGFASRSFRELQSLQQFSHLSDNGNEVCFCTIGDAATSEGHFWETVNTAGVLQIPVAFFVWDDGYGISVPTDLQTTKGSISEALKGFQKKEGTNGIDIYKVKAWDYAAMCEVFETGIQKIRNTHVPALFHVEEVTQPQGHSTSGSHERYKAQERLQWEREWDCLRKMKEWILENALASEEELIDIEVQAKSHIRKVRNSAWDKYLLPIKLQVVEAVERINRLAADLPEKASVLEKLTKDLSANREPNRRDVLVALHRSLLALKDKSDNRSDIETLAAPVQEYYDRLKEENRELYNTHLYFSGARKISNIAGKEAIYAADTPLLNGYEVLNRYFDELFAANPLVFAFGEDLGRIGDVNQGFAGLQAKYGKGRIFDTGIRELTIIGQGIGMALRGLRPIAEIQYLDYLLYGLQPLSDDAATLHFRTAGKQCAPLIVRTRGHRLEGIWHTGSPMGMIVNSLRGMHVCVPRNMVQAIGMYNTLLKGMDPGIVIESLNGYRLKEKLPSNLLEYTVPLGVPEIIREGSDITLVSYGSMLRIIEDAARVLAERNIHCEIIDVQTLLPFDTGHLILGSLKKTSRILFIDEDVPGGAAAYMFNKVMEEQGGYRWVDAAPRTLTAKDHRTAYASDGDYFGKPNAEEIIDTVLEMMRE